MPVTLSPVRGGHRDGKRFARGRRPILRATARSIAEDTTFNCKTGRIILAGDVRQVSGHRVAMAATARSFEVSPCPLS